MVECIIAAININESSPGRAVSGQSNILSCFVFHHTSKRSEPGPCGDPATPSVLEQSRENNLCRTLRPNPLSSQSSNQLEATRLRAS